jgi:AdoMet-dependent rRNA methyltransferase SPB1
LDAPAEKDTQRDEIVPEEAAVDSEDDDDKVQADLEKLDAEEKARQKREKRKANERKTRTIRRMQLQMTAPMDIGMEQHDQSLQAGQDDLLDRDVAEADISSESDPASDMDDDAESVDSSSPNKKMEDELDALYEEYNRRKSEKDAKFKVQEMRKKNKYRDEEWRGIDENANQSGSEEEGRGGWDYVERMKAKDDSDSDSDSGSDEPAPRPPQKRQKREPAPVPPKNAKAARAVQQWFGQDLFEGMGEDFAEADEVSFSFGDVRVLTSFHRLKMWKWVLKAGRSRKMMSGRPSRRVTMMRLRLKQPLRPRVSTTLITREVMLI